MTHRYKHVQVNWFTGSGTPKTVHEGGDNLPPPPPHEGIIITNINHESAESVLKVQHFPILDSFKY